MDTTMTMDQAKITDKGNGPCKAHRLEPYARHKIGEIIDLVVGGKWVCGELVGLSKLNVNNGPILYHARLVEDNSRLVNSLITRKSKIYPDYLSDMILQACVESKDVLDDIALNDFTSDTASVSTDGNLPATPQKKGRIRQIDK